MIKVFTKKGCHYCTIACDLLTKEGCEFELFDIEESYENRKMMLSFNPSARTVPQIVVSGKSIGGYTDLAERISSGTFCA